MKNNSAYLRDLLRVNRSQRNTTVWFYIHIFTASINLFAEISAMYCLANLFVIDESSKFNTNVSLLGISLILVALSKAIIEYSIARIFVSNDENLKLTFSRRAMNSNWSEITSLKGSELNNALLSESSHIASLTSLFTRVVGNAVSLCLFLSFAIVREPQIMIPTLLFVLIIVSVYRLSTRKQSRLQASLLESNRDLSHFAIFLARGFKTLKQSNVFKVWLKTLEVKIIQFEALKLKEFAAPIKGRLLIEVQLVLFIVGYISYKGESNLVEILIIFGVFFRIVPKIQGTFQMYRNLIDSEIWLEKWTSRIHYLSAMEKPSEIMPGIFPMQCMLGTPSLSLLDIDFRHNDSTSVLSNFKLSLNHGEFVYFSGRSGIGKSTLADVISGLLYVNRGSVFTCGHSVRTGSQSLPIVVSAESEIFGKDIESLLTWSIEELYDADSIERVKVITGIDKMFLYETSESNAEAGSDLSSGMKARLLIARALLEEPHLLILDEITTRLDVESETEILNRIKLEYPLLSLIIISHRITVEKLCNRTINIGN